MSNPSLLHLVARTASRARPFQHRIACADLWSRITRNFDLVACVLMPDHVHVLAQIEEDIALRAFGRVLSAFRLRMQATARVELAFEWERVPQPEKVQHDKRHIARTVRYIHLNPTRDALCGDPLEWEWSTHRDWIGAVARACVDRSRWARAMGRRMPSCAEWLHEYVSSDISVPRPSPLIEPTAYLQAGMKDASLDTLAGAVASVSRSRCSAPHEFGAAERRLFLLSAARWAHYRAPELARCVGCHPTNALKMMRCNASNDESERGLQFERAPHGEAGPVPKRRRWRTSSAESRTRRVPLNPDEVRAMALALADPRLLALPRSGLAVRCRWRA